MILALALAIVYGGALIGKIMAFGAFRNYLGSLLAWRTPYTAAGVLCIEALIAAGLLAGVAAAPLRPVAGIASALFLIGATAIHAAFSPGPVASCRCFGRASSPTENESFWNPSRIGFRNGVLVAGSMVLFTHAPVFVAICAGIPAGLIAARLIASIARQRQILRAGTDPRAREVGATMPLLLAQTWWVDGHPRGF